MASPVTPEEVNDFMAKEMPSSREMGISCEEVGPGYAVARFAYSDRWLRPGGYINGPTLMSLADSVFYFAVFGTVGIEPMAVTSELSMNFLRPAMDKDVLARAELFRVGRRVIYGEVRLWLDGEPDRLVAHATASYVRPGS